MNIYALYLPQFHETKENNEWWGKGFTEWVNVKKAVPLYEGHLQPKHPVNDYYYNLLAKETVIWQTELMHQYCIDGMIYYHYYFNGKLILEKPAENLLKWKDIDQPFFFNWANHTWNRSWKGSKEVLVEQTYGDINDWKRHFEYLLPFFQDDRYIKIENKPLFIIYDSGFKEKNQMFERFDQWCKDAGFAGLYLIEECFTVVNNQLDQCVNQKSTATQKIYLTEPLVGRSLFNHNKSKLSIYMDKIRYHLNQKGIKKMIQKYDGDTLLKLVMNHKISHAEMIIPGLFFEWDNTPRHGNRGHIIEAISKDVFNEYMDYYKNSDFMIVNAWNEWCEGMMLEPTKELGCKYLEWIRDWKQKNYE